MGAGIAIAANDASAVAKAYTQVLDKTNVFQDQKVIQTQGVDLDNCDITAAKNIGITMSDRMKQSAKQVSNVKNQQSIANDIAQAMTQAATSNIGVGVIGIADSNNRASTYANINTNVANYVVNSSKQSYKSQQTFSCQDSTIVSSNGGVNISELDDGDAEDQQFSTSVDSTVIKNTITQTISQTATSKMGLSWYVLLALAVLALIGGVIWKLKDSKSTADHAVDIKEAIELGCCDPNSELDLKLKGGAVGAVGASGAANECAGCDCYKLMHPEMHVSRGSVIVYIIGALLIWGTVGLWYGMVSRRGCLYDDACTAEVGNPLTSGCSCNFDVDNSSGKGCQDTVANAKFSGNGVPLKYQYALFTYNQSSDDCGTPPAQSAASLQGMLIALMRNSSTEANSNNGKNFNTLARYMGLYGWSADLAFDSSRLAYASTQVKTLLPIQNIFNAAVDFIDNQSDGDSYARLAAVINAGSSTGFRDDPGAGTNKGANLFAYLCPLRPVFFGDQDPSTVLRNKWMVPSSTNTDQYYSDALDNTGWPSYSSGTPAYGVLVLPAFRYGSSPTKDTDSNNPDAGCCSLHSMTYNPNGNTDYTGTCGSGGTISDGAEAEDFCSGVGTHSQPDHWNVKYGHGLVSKLPDVTNKEAYLSVSTDDPGDQVKMYAEYTRFPDTLSPQEKSLIRLLWSAILAYRGGGAVDTIWGLNAFMVTNGQQSQPDHFYSKASVPPQIFASMNETAGGDHLQNDHTVLQVTMLASSSYDVELGMQQKDCSEGLAVQNQGYTGTAQKIGYCKSWFFNRVTLYTIIAVGIIWTMLLPVFLISRWYINRNVSGKYLAMAKQIQTSGQKRSQPESSQQQPSQPSQPQQPVIANANCPLAGVPSSQLACTNDMDAGQKRKRYLQGVKVAHPDKNPGCVDRAQATIVNLQKTCT